MGEFNLHPSFVALEQSRATGVQKDAVLPRNLYEKVIAFGNKICREADLPTGEVPGIGCQFFGTQEYVVEVGDGQFSSADCCQESIQHCLLNEIEPV